ncbi:MAG: hypothetical protein DRO87_09320 [Candidatus Thorarchaeota archaeon]|nr:MAG: hypothetical protein DRP09_11540 [Candidatus Thorarchaeota archaeon]RLI55144.1 MAG: hypothetical protein DRO87_09320 [Candidatus Thorarchaeota archaeon]
MAGLVQTVEFFVRETGPLAKREYPGIEKDLISIGITNPLHEALVAQYVLDLSSKPAYAFLEVFYSEGRIQGRRSSALKASN